MMKAKNFYVIIALLVLMILRLFVSGYWFSTIVIAGFLVALSDIINRVHNENKLITTDKQKIRYAAVLISLYLVFTIVFIILIVNAVVALKWINNPTVLDEITLLTLLISLPQNILVSIINKYISR